MIIAVKPNSLSAKDKEKLTKIGYTVIEVEDPDSLRFIEPEAPIEVHDYYMAALNALNTGTSSDCARFVADLYIRLKKKEESKEDKTV
jgi:RNA polymerase-interacting CarD/CdnL/TRCF family regulator